MLTAIPAEAAKMISDQTNLKITGFSFVGGGCINHGGKLDTTSGAYFLKWNDALKYPGMFQAEALGLSVLRTSNAIRIPQVINVGQTRSHQYIVLEFIESAPKHKDYWPNLGRSLASLHQINARAFGLDHNNYIGSLRQDNNQHPRWADFFIEQRLDAQLKLAVHKKLADTSLVQQFERLYKKLPAIFPQEKPSLLHGDLWSGNLITDEHGQPCLIDPAVNYGHREAELAFTHLFGGFDPQFYEAYEEIFPLQPGFTQRMDLYNLYPLLVHANLFGQSYIAQIKSVLRRYEFLSV
jgi:protein-ribulosamine 3-kinase